jgi:hypothetical protein
VAQTPARHAPEQHSVPALQVWPWFLQLHLPVSALQFQLLGHPISEHDLHFPPAWQMPNEHCASFAQPVHLLLMHGYPFEMQSLSLLHEAHLPETQRPVLAEQSGSLEQGEHTLLTQLLVVSEQSESIEHDVHAPAAHRLDAQSPGDVHGMHSPPTQRLEAHCELEEQPPPWVPSVMMTWFWAYADEERITMSIAANPNAWPNAILLPRSIVSIMRILI